MKDSHSLSFFTFIVFTRTSNNTKYEKIYYPNHILSVIVMYFF